MQKAALRRLFCLGLLAVTAVARISFGGLLDLRVDGGHGLAVEGPGGAQVLQGTGGGEGAQGALVPQVISVDRPLKWRHLFLGRAHSWSSG